MSDALLARIDAHLNDDPTSAGCHICVGLIADCRAALAERIPREPFAWTLDIGNGPNFTVSQEVANSWRSLGEVTPLYAAVPGIPRERDAERLDWLDRDDIDIHFTMRMDKPIVLIFNRKGRLIGEGLTLREAVDMAIAGDSHG